MGRRFVIVIGVAAAGVIALGAQTAAAPNAAAPNVVKYDTKVTIAVDGQPRGRIYHGVVRSKVRKCMKGRRVILFQARPGPNRVLGAALATQLEGGPEDDTPRAPWSVQAGSQPDVYAKVLREEGDGFVCRDDRSKTCGRCRHAPYKHSERTRVPGRAAGVSQ